MKADNGKQKLKRMARGVRFSALHAAALLGLLLSAPAQAVLNETCVVSVLNRTVQVKADGSWVLPNIPANMGAVRARATCVQNGLTTPASRHISPSPQTAPSTYRLSSWEMQRRFPPKSL